MESEQRSRGPEADEKVETEWQFEAADLEAIRRSLEGIGDRFGLVLGPPSIRVIDDLYLDTADWRVFRGGFALRIRGTGEAGGSRGRREATLKALVAREEGPAVRQEITQPLPPEDRSLVPPTGPVGDRLHVLCKTGDLRIIAEIHTSREAYEIAANPGPLGELVLDATVLRDPNGTVHQLRRLEIEVEARHKDDVAPFADFVRTSCYLDPVTESKFEWALTALGLSPRESLSLLPAEAAPEMTVAEAAFAVLRKRFSSMLWHEPGTRLGEDPEHLHDMRVSTRRMRAALRFFPGAMPPKETDRLRADLRVLGQGLGKVRDLDVHIEQVRIWREILTSVAPEAADPIIRILEAERSARREELLRLLDSKWFGKLEASITARLKAGVRRRILAASPPIPVEGPRLIRRARRRVMRYGKRLDPTSAPAEELHRLRILCKRLRYALEFLEPIYGPPAREMIHPLVALQDLLGLHHDAVVSIAALQALARGGAGELSAECRGAVDELVGLYSARATSIRTQVPAAFARLSGKVWKDLRQAMKQVKRQAKHREEGAPDPGTEGSEDPAPAPPGEPTSPPGSSPSPGSSPPPGATVPLGAPPPPGSDPT